MKLLGAAKLSEPPFCNSPCCSIASGLCLVTNKKTLIPNKIQIMNKFLDGATKSHWVGLSEILSWCGFHDKHGLRNSSKVFLLFQGCYRSI